MKALEVEVLEMITTYYEGARGRGTRGNYNLFKLILGASPVSAQTQCSTSTSDSRPINLFKLILG
ncbi:hypothetical protein GIB67_040273 [Kingdonia uniflora]|uniref:Uncharacterized protein n=1 Tax=Kingdonia uniflora TaxID=39325 RepID=A0A7J7MV00_9MAGN|nr:hypothetical protein GIB67_040273 [Kingdonia uniflora]